MSYNPPEGGGGCERRVCVGRTRRAAGRESGVEANHPKNCGAAEEKIWLAMGEEGQQVDLENQLNEVDQAAVVTTALRSA